MRGHGITFRYGALLGVMVAVGAGWVWSSWDAGPGSSAVVAPARTAKVLVPNEAAHQPEPPAESTQIEPRHRRNGFSRPGMRKVKAPPAAKRIVSPADPNSKTTLANAIARQGTSLRSAIESKLPEAEKEEAKAPVVPPGKSGASVQPQTDAGGAMDYAVQKRLPEGMTHLPMERYLEAYEQIRTSPRYSTAESRQLVPFADEPTARMAEDIGAQPTVGTWVPLGPGNIGGRTRALLIDPGNPSVMYAAGVAGGIWKTTNGGTTWAPKADLLANIAVSSLAMDPSNSSVLYAGTGEGFFNVDAVRGLGIYKSTDAGETWNPLGTTNVLPSNFLQVNDIVVSSLNPSRIYAATRQGVFRTLDGGANWSQVVFFTANGGCTDLAIRTDQPTDYVYAACGIFTNGAIWRHTDAASGTSWTRLLGGSGQPESQMGRLSLAIAKSNQNTIYALAMQNTAGGNFRNGLWAVFRSTSSGDAGTWSARVRNTDATKLNTVLLTNSLIAFASECGQGSSSFLNQGWYDNVIAVDPADENRVWVGGIDLFRSDDGGANWGLASYWWSSPPSAHADHHIIVFHPGYDGTSNKTMFVGNDGGIYRTDDARAAVATGTTAPCTASNTAVAWTELNNGYGVTQFYHGLPYPGGATYLGGTQDNGTLRSSDAAGSEAWSMIRGGDGGYVAIDPGNTDTLYGANPNGGFFKSTNGGSDFSSITTGLSESGFQFITPFTMDPLNAQRLWTGGFFIWRTDNAAGDWARASALTPGAGSVSALAVKPNDSNTVLVGMSDGFILRNAAALSANDTTNWTPSQPRSGNVSWLAFDPATPNVVYATYSTFGGGHIYKSTDGGATWSQGFDATGLTGLPDIPVHSLVVDPNNSARLYLGTDAGVFVSLDGGISWMVENTGFANVITEALAVTDRSGTPNLFGFTHGRGVWRVPLLSIGTAPVLSLMTPSRVVAGGPDLTLTVFGANFANNAVVRWNGSDRATTFVHSGQLTATLLAADTASAGSGSVTVFNPTAGASSEALTFTLDSGSNLSPAILSLSPTTVREGGGDFLVTISGNTFSPTFSPSVRARWNGQDRPTFFLSNTSLMMQVFASDIAAAGSGNVQLFAPAPGGGTSNFQTITIGTPKVAAAPSSLNFGNQLQNTTSGSQTITLTNNGTLNASLNNINTSSSGPGTFPLTNNCGFTVTAGNSCTMVFTFTPNGIGNVAGTLSFTHNGFGITSPIVIALSGAGVGPGVNLSTTTTNFGNQSVGTTSAATTVTMNNGEANPITIASIVASGEFGQNNDCGASLSAGATCNINITFSPGSIGSKTGSVVVTDSGGGSPRTISLSGTGVAAQVSLPQNNLTFGAHVPGRKVPQQSMFLTNTGNLNLVISNFTATGNYSVSHNCISNTVNANGGSCSLFFDFLNTAPAGAVNGTATLTTNATGSPHIINLSATSVNFTLSLTRPMRSRRNSSNGTANQPDTFDVSVTPAPEMTGVMAFACEGAPPGVSCVVAPATVQLDGQPVTARVTVTTASRSQRLRGSTRRRNVILKLRATWQGGITQVLDLPVQIQR